MGLGGLWDSTMRAMSTHKPMVGITTDVVAHPNGERVFTYRPYVEAVVRAGGVPVLLPPVAEVVGGVGAYVDRLDAFVLTGGDDPCTEHFGEPTHAKVTRVHEDRQAFETGLLEELARVRPEVPVLGVCLGMQMMALVAGGRLEQYMPETCATHEVHWGQEHAVEPMGDAGIAGGKGMVLRGVVHSKHKQGVAEAGRLVVIARAPDGVAEAVCDPARRFYVGVQWHPERTGDTAVGQGVFEALVNACCAATEP